MAVVGGAVQATHACLMGSRHTSRLHTSLGESIEDVRESLRRPTSEAVAVSNSAMLLSDDPVTMLSPLLAKHRVRQELPSPCASTWLTS